MARKHGFFRPHVAGLSGIYSTTLREGVGGFSVAAFLAEYPAARWWSPRQAGLADGTALSQVNDLSANANHWVQATGANQPTFNIEGGIGRARFGADDFMQLAASAALDIGTVGVLTAIAAVRHTKASGAGAIFEQQAPTVAGGGYGLYINNGSAGAVGGGIGADASNYNFRDVSGVGAVPRNYMVTATIDPSQAAASEIDLRIDGIAQSSVSAAAAGTVTGNIPKVSVFSVGKRYTGSTLFFNSDLFDLLIIPGGLTGDDLTRTEEYVFNACGF